MRYKNILISFLSKIKRSQFIKSIRRLLFQQSHLSPYLPIMKEQLSQKLVRIYQDHSYNFQQIDFNNHNKNHKFKIQIFYNQFLFSKKCYDPLNNWLMLWYALVFISIVITYFLTGMALIFGQQAWKDIDTNPLTITLNTICIIVFIVDIFVQMNAGFLFRGMIIWQKQRAISRYIRYFCIIDVLLILILIISMGSQFYYMNVLKTIIALKFIRMFEIDDLYMRKLSTQFKKKVIYVIFKQMVTIFIIAHTIGTIFYAIDYSLLDDPICQNNASLCWLNSAVAYSPIINYGWRVRYFYSLYWGINTIATISYGDIAANNPYEVCYALLCFCFSLMTYGYVVNNIVKTILWSRQLKDNFRSQLILYTTFMQNLQISSQHQYQFREYLQYQYFQQKQRSFVLEQEMKAKLPVDLRDQLMKSAYYQIHNALSQIIFSSPSLVKLIYFLQQKKYTENELILSQGQPLKKMYYLQNGEVNLRCFHYEKQYNITSIKNKDIFLSLYEYFLDQRARYTIKTAKNSTLYFLDRQKIQHEHQKFTDLRENFKLVQYQLLFHKNYKKIFYNCYFCQASHHWYNCIKSFPDFTNVTLFNNPLNKTIHNRISMIKSNVWKGKKLLMRLQQQNNNLTNRILRKVQQRIYELKILKQQLKNNFDIDIHHQWKYYLPDHNLSKFKQQWNKNKRRQTLPLFGLQLPFVDQKIFNIK